MSAEHPSIDEAIRDAWIGLRLRDRNTKRLVAELHRNGLQIVAAHPSSRSNVRAVAPPAEVECVACGRYGRLVSVGRRVQVQHPPTWCPVGVAS